MKPEFKSKDFSHASAPKLLMLLHACSIAVFIIVCYALPLSFELKTMNTLYVSQATTSGVDIGLRVSATYRCIFGGTGLIAVFYILFQWIHIKALFRFRQHHEFSILSGCIICLSFLHIMGVDQATVLKIFAALFVLRMIMLLPIRPLKRFSALLADKLFFGLALSFAFLLLFGLFFLAGWHPGLRSDVALIYIALVILCIVLMCLLQRWGYTTRQQLLVALLPLTVMPPLAFLLIELMFKIRQAYGISFPYRLCFVAALAVFFLLTWLFRKRRVLAGQDPGTLIRRVIGPSLIATFVLLTYYTPLLPPQTEMFESGNVANSVLNVFHFGKIPILDFGTAHMLSEQWFAYLYALIFGLQDTQDFVIYSFLNSMLVIVIGYYLLNKLFRRPLLSAFFIILFPFFKEVFYPYVFMAVLPVFLSRPLLERPAPALFLKLFLLLFAMVLWKIDTGASAIFASLIYFPVLWLVTGRQFPFRAALTGMLFFILILTVLLVCACLLRSPAIVYNSFQMCLHLFSASQAHGYSQLMYDPPQQFYIYYVLFPAVAVVSSAYILILLRQRSGKAPWQEQYLLLTSLFLFLLFLGNLQRGLVRHGFAERGETIVSSTFFIALALLIVYRLRTRVATLRMAGLYAAAFFLFLLFKFFPYSDNGYSLQQALVNNPFQTNFQKLDWHRYRNRTLIDTAFEQENFVALKSFLDRNVKRDKTFLDFSNNPVLYFYTRRPVAGYFAQNMQNSVDDFLQEDMLKQFDTAKAPVVLWANYPRNFFDGTDDVPNALRYYLVAEHILSNYKPYGIIGNKSVWIAKSFHTHFEPLIRDTLIDQVDSVNFSLLSEYTGLFFSGSSGKKGHSKDLERMLSWDAGDLTMRNDSLFVPLGKDLLALQNCYLAVEFEKADAYFEPFNMEVLFINPNKQVVGKFIFTRRDRASTIYMFRLSNHYFWHRYSGLELCIPQGSAIKRVSVLRDR